MTNVRVACLLSLAVTGGCGPKGAGGGAAPAPVGAAGHAKGTEGVLWQASADLDGDGREEAITLVAPDVKQDSQQRDQDARINVPVTECVPPGDTCRATLTIGAATLDLEVHPGYFGGLGLQVIDIDAKDPRKELIITRRGDSEEDPWYEFTAVLYDGGAIYQQALWHAGGYNSGTATPDGRGTLAVQYDECPDSFTVKYRREPTQLVEFDRKTVRTSNPDQCAACPFVYLLDGGDFALQGEILRNLNRAEGAGRQSLLLAGAGGDTITVELREEKDEVTFLDEIHLEAGGASLAPAECDTAQAFCAADGAYHLLHRGETLRLTFSLGTNAAPAGGAAPRLVATGYYLPL